MVKKKSFSTPRNPEGPGERKDKILTAQNPHVQPGIDMRQFILQRERRHRIKAKWGEMLTLAPKHGRSRNYECCPLLCLTDGG